ncbi:MAG: Cys-tRNA(Pro) deacylase [Lachnospiraceae bacterium]
MAKQKEVKTNAMRTLDRMKIAYTHQFYECEEFVDGIQTADHLGLPHEKVYKTLVTLGASRQYFVFVLPIEAELDMKKAAKAVGEKSVAMIHVKDITAVTGYVRGGCTAIGMKKQYKTVISDTAEKLDQMYVSGGKIGCQIMLSPEDLCKASGGVYGDIIVK